MLIIDGNCGIILFVCIQNIIMHNKIYYTHNDPVTAGVRHSIGLQSMYGDCGGN